MKMHDGGIASKEKAANFGEVFTPKWLVNDMLDMLAERAEEDSKEGEATIDPFAPEFTFLDPACGEGQFPIEILRRKFERCRKKADFETAALSVYGFDIQSNSIDICIENVLELCREHFRVSKKLEVEIKKRYIMGDSLKFMPLLAQYGEGHEVIFVPVPVKVKEGDDDRASEEGADIQRKEGLGNTYGVI